MSPGEGLAGALHLRRRTQAVRRAGEAPGRVGDELPVLRRVRGGGLPRLQLESADPEVHPGAGWIAGRRAPSPCRCLSRAVSLGVGAGHRSERLARTATAPAAITP